MQSIASNSPCVSHPVAESRTLSAYIPPCQNEEEPSVHETFPITPLDIFLSARVQNLAPRDPKSQAVESMRKREWRIVSDEEVEKKVQRCLPCTTISDLSVGMHLLPFGPAWFGMTLDPMRVRERPHVRELLSMPCHFEGGVVVRSERLTKGFVRLDTEIGSEPIPYFAVFGGLGGSSCVDFVETHLHEILTSSFLSLPRSVISSSQREEKAPATRTAYVWNALKLAGVKLQERFALEGQHQRQATGSSVFSSASLCVLFCIQSEIWCLTQGSARALLFNEEEQTIRPLSPNMSFSNASLSHSIEKRGGHIQNTPRICPHTDKTVWWPLLGGIVPDPRTLGALDIPGMALRPKVTKTSLREGERATVVLATKSFWEPLTGPHILSVISKTTRGVGEKERLESIGSQLCSEVNSTERASPFSCFVLSTFE